MPYRKRRRHSSQYALAKKAVRNELKKIVEVKKFYTNGTHSIDTAGVFAIPLTGITAGTGSTQRLGANINVLSMNLRVNMENGDPNNTVRMMCVETYEEVDTVLTTPYDLFNPLTAGFVGAINAPINRQLVKRVLYDKTINLNPNWNGASKFKYLSAYAKVSKMGRKIQYDEATGVPQSGHYAWLWVSDSALPNHPRIRYSLELRFSDL